MKTHGICHAQSARKHRRAGHFVHQIETQRGRYHWKRTWPTDHEAEIATDHDPLKGMNPTAIIVGEEHSFEEVLKLSGVKVEIPIARVTEIDTPQRIEIPTERGMVRISVGDAYWPKRRNQHSKPYRVVGFRDDGSVIFARGDDVVSGTMDAAEFLTVIGKQA